MPPPPKKKELKEYALEFIPHLPKLMTQDRMSVNFVELEKQEETRNPRIESPRSNSQGAIVVANTESVLSVDTKREELTSLVRRAWQVPQE